MERTKIQVRYLSVTYFDTYFYVKVFVIITVKIEGSNMSWRNDIMIRKKVVLGIGWISC